jgi:hypothetical protein
MALYDPQTDVPAEIVPDLTKPSLEALAYVLEHVERWPQGWKWDFSAVNECGTAGCALGIAHTLWGNCGPTLGVDFVSRDSVDCGQMNAVFNGGTFSSEITPAIVAARIRDHLAGRPVRYK